MRPGTTPADFNMNSEMATNKTATSHAGTEECDPMCFRSFVTDALPFADL